MSSLGRNNHHCPAWRRPARQAFLVADSRGFSSRPSRHSIVFLFDLASFVAVKPLSALIGLPFAARNVARPLAAFGAALLVSCLIPGARAADAVEWGEEILPWFQPGIRFKAIAAGRMHTLALKHGDGTVLGWGDNSWGYPVGQSTVPAGLSNVVAIASGLYHNLALNADGTVVAWGFDGDGETTVPAGLSNVVAVACGGYHSLSLKADGTVVAWGQDAFTAKALCQPASAMSLPSRAGILTARPCGRTAPS